MREPTNRRDAWRRWRERLAGVRPDEWTFDWPECGRYRSKRNGQAVGVQIDLVAGEVDETTGELMSDERFVAWIGDEKFEAFERVVAIWQHSGDKPICDAEFRRLAGLPAQVDLARDVIV